MNTLFHCARPGGFVRARPFVALVFGLALGSAGLGAEDDFNDNSKDASRWGADSATGYGQLFEANARLEYRCSPATPDDNAWRPWVGSRFPYTSDWTVQFDVVNTSDPFQAFHVNSIGILIQTTHASGREMFTELYASSLGGPGSGRTGYYAEIEPATGDDIVVDREGGSGVTHGAIRVEFNGATKVMSVFYDLDSRDGYQWVAHASFGLDGAGGADGNTDWELSEADQFAVSIYGYSAGMIIASGQMYVDNFVETGGVASTGGAVPDPVGSFEFGFPVNNPLVTSIFSVSGNYRGVSPTAFQRAYDLDIAQDESGKVMAMGTIAGLTDESGSPELASSVGAVKTVNGTPTAALKGKFRGTRDGESATYSGAATGPLEISDIGGGTEGFVATGSYKANFGGIPVSGQNVPVSIAAPEGTGESLRREWSLDIEISRKLIKGKERTVASAELILPNGDTIEFGERQVKYSRTRGYTLAFKRGTNVSRNPSVVDKKTSVVIRGMTFEQDGDDWEPTGGTIDYRFLGQKGVANLMDFASP